MNDHIVYHTAFKKRSIPWGHHLAQRVLRDCTNLAQPENNKQPGGGYRYWFKVQSCLLYLLGTVS